MVVWQDFHCHGFAYLIPTTIATDDEQNHLDLVFTRVISRSLVGLGALYVNL